jgi:hypothetical protein
VITTDKNTTENRPDRWGIPFTRSHGLNEERMVHAGFVPAKLAQNSFVSSFTSLSLMRSELKSGFIQLFIAAFAVSTKRCASRQRRKRGFQTMFEAWKKF